MNDDELRQEIQRLVEQDDAELLSAFVDSQDWNAAGSETVSSVLQLIALYGYSGRTTRYEAAIRRILENETRVSLATYVLLALNSEAKQLIVANNALAFQVTDKGENLLHLAAERGNLDIASTLCRHGVNVNQEDSKGEAPIHRALHAGPWKNERAVDVAELLLEHGAQVDLWTLAALGDEAGVEAYVATHPFETNSFDRSGASALYHACHNNRVPVVKKLLQLGADPNLANADGDTPLSTACLHTQSQECDLEIIRSLIEYGASNTLESAVVLDDLDSIRRFLSDTDHISDSNLDSAFATAIHAWHPESLKQLIASGRKPNETEWKHIERICRSDDDLLRELRTLQ